MSEKEESIKKSCFLATATSQTVESFVQKIRTGLEKENKTTNLKFSFEHVKI